MTHHISTIEGKREFITSLCDAVKNDALAKAENMPAEWDGHEIRRYLADKFEREAWTLGPKADKSYRRRYRAYRNEVLTRGDL